MGQHHNYGCDFNTYQICREVVVVPDTKDHNCSYSDWLMSGDAPEEVIGHHPLPIVGPATHFVSHAWGFNFQMFMRSLRNYVTTSTTAEEKANGIYFWIDIFVVDQHAAARGDMDESYWETTFRAMVNQIGHTVMVLDHLPKSVPTVLSRIWCIWELHSTISSHENLLSVALDDETEVSKSVRETALVHELMNQIQSIKSADAQATVVSDRDKINRLVAASDGGHSAIDGQVQCCVYGMLCGIAAKYCDDDAIEQVKAFEQLVQLTLSPINSSSSHPSSSTSTDSQAPNLLRTNFCGRTPLTWSLTLDKPNITQILLDVAGLNVEEDCSPTLDLNGYGEVIGYGSVYDENKLTQVPHGVMSMSALIDLNLSNNLLTSLPDEFAALSSLKSVNLSINRFEKIPFSLVELCGGGTKGTKGSLETINLSNNQLTNQGIESVASLVPSMVHLLYIDIRLNDNLDYDRTVQLFQSSLGSSITILPSVARPQTPREKAVAILLERFASQNQLGTAKPTDVKEVAVPRAYWEKEGKGGGNNKLYYISIDAGGVVGGWGEKAMIANLSLNKCFVTQMGFHRAYWSRKALFELGAPISDEFGNSDPPHDKCGGGATQKFELGNLYWNSSNGVFMNARETLEREKEDGK